MGLALAELVATGNLEYCPDSYDNIAHNEGGDCQVRAAIFICARQLVHPRITARELEHCDESPVFAESERAQIKDVL